MTLVQRAERAATTPVRGFGRLRRLWAASIGVHIAAQAVILVALIPVVGTDASFSADEGAAIVQARSLADGEGWIVEHPIPEADPTNRAYPLELSHEGPDGVAPFAKHPVYALLLAAVDGLGGVAAMVLLSVAGTIAAAAAAAALARRLDPSLARPALWTVGLASPLLFDSYLVIAHSLGAAAVAAAALVAVIALERRSVTIAIGAAPLLAVAILLRTEATLLAAGLALVAGVVALRREQRWPAAAMAVGALGAAVVARLLEPAWATSIVGGETLSSAPPHVDPYGLLDGRLNALVLTWLRPSYDGPRLVDLALVLMMAGVALGAFVARRRPDDRSGIVLAASLAVIGGIGGLLASPDNVVPGLLAAFPLGLAGLLLVDRTTLQPLAAKVLFGTFAVFSAAVIATQYSSGGTAEWGGRYFAIGLPLLVPVALAALRLAASRIGPAAARTALIALVACSVAMAVMSVTSIRSTHRFTATLMSRIDEAGRATGQERPVLVATSGAIPRLAWDTFDRQRWLLVTSDDLAATMARLRDLGLDRATFVTRDERHDRPKLGDRVQVVGTTPTPGNGWTILTLSLS